VKAIESEQFKGAVERRVKSVLDASEEKEEEKKIDKLRRAINLQYVSTLALAYRWNQCGDTLKDEAKKESVQSAIKTLFGEWVYGLVSGSGGGFRFASRDRSKTRWAGIAVLGAVTLAASLAGARTRL
jgi:hypothetical protein